MKKLAKKVLLIGWDAADWKVINKLMDQGKMPAMQSLVNNGTIGNLATLEPPFSPMLWTSIATGKRADKHGILGFVEPTPGKVGVRPVSSTSRKVKTIWNILNQNQYKSHVVGWWPSHPAEPINGIMVTNLYQKAEVDRKKWKMSPRMVHPPALAPLFHELRVHPEEITSEHILPFVPNAKKIDQEKDKRIYHVAKNIAEASTIHSATTWIMENEDWDFMAVYLDTIDHFCHGFMNFYPPKMDHVPGEMYKLYKNVVDGAYIFHDMMLERLIKIAGKDTTIMLLSDHGFHSDHLRPKFIPSEPAGPAFQHRDHGVLCISGPNIKKDENIYGASLLDITPTLLTMFGLPIGQDMDGVPLVQIFDKNVEVESISSWEFIDGNTGMHPKEIIEDPVMAQEAIKQLVELGYIDDPGEDKQKAVEKTIRETDYNLGRVYMGAMNYMKAIEIFEKLYNNNPDEPRFSIRLALCYVEVNKFQDCEKLIKSIKPKEEKKILTDAQMNELNKQTIAKDLTEEELKNIKNKNNELIKKSKLAKRNVHYLKLIQGDIYLRNNHPKKALELFDELQQELPKQKNLLLKFANAYLKLKKWSEAEKIFNEVLKIDNNSHQAYHGLSIAYLRMKSYEKAVDMALTAIGLFYYSPRVHYHLGEALFRIKEYEHAANAFNVCLSIAPGMAAARNYLIDIYTEYLDEPNKAKIHQLYFEDKSEYTKQKQKDITTNDHYENDTIEKLIKRNDQLELENQEPIILVSGLPRSGTSLVMQILEKAGIDILTDEKRKADESNPKGYYEYEAVKNLAGNNAWIGKAKGKAIKVVSHLLFYLPPKFVYKIIFIERDIKEVVRSQHKMLIRNGKAKPGNYPANLEIAFHKNLEKVRLWDKTNHNVEILYVRHRKLIENPIEEIEKIIRFIELDTSPQELSKVVDKQLHREKLNE